MLFNCSILRFLLNLFLITSVRTIGNRRFRPELFGFRNRSEALQFMKPRKPLFFSIFFFIFINYAFFANWNWAILYNKILNIRSLLWNTSKEWSTINMMPKPNYTITEEIWCVLLIIPITIYLFLISNLFSKAYTSFAILNWSCSEKGP